jgi:hypothetical protein
MKYEDMNAYRDGFCAGFNGWQQRPCSNQVDQQAYDRGLWAGMKAKEKLGR